MEEEPPKESIPNILPITHGHEIPPYHEKHFRDKIRIKPTSIRGSRHIGEISTYRGST